ncbi:MAG: protein kinase [Planctomycetes bacterium]|nr:protein kinase [Planctomycetota bacterium]
MSLRVRWQTDEDEGAFPLRARPLHLVFFDGVFDISGALGEGQDGLTLSPPDSEGKVDLQAYGELEFTAAGKRFQRVRLPIGGQVGFTIGDWEGSLRAEGKAPVSDPLVGTELGGYRLLGRLGAGAVGVVYRALQINLDREVALKVLDAEVAKRSEAVASFRREAQAAGRLTHPHVVQVYDVGEAEGRLYYTMELVAGGDLEDRLEDGGAMPWEEAVAAARDCCRALAFAEEKGLVHRDVKPENLMVAPGGLVKLADLGLAATRGMLDQEAAGGTPHFMAPEAVGKQSAVDHRSDLYSVGCSLYRLLTKDTVFEGSSVKEILRAHRDEEPPRLRDAGVHAPRELEEVLVGLLAKDPDERYQHASEVVEELEALLEAPVGGKKAWLVVSLVAIFGAAGWVAFGPKAEPTSSEPQRVVEYIERGGVDEEELERERVRAAYFEALAKPAADGVRLAALQQFLVDYPEAEQKVDAQVEIDRLQAVLDEEIEVPPAETEEARQAREALQAELATVRAALANQLFGQARGLVRGSERAEEVVMTELAREVDRQAGAQFATWEEVHRSALNAQDWSAAEGVRALFATSLGELSPPEWQARQSALEVAAEEGFAIAQAEAFRAQRENFLSLASAPVRAPLLQFDLEAATAAWIAASDAVEHRGLQELADERASLFELARDARAAFDERVQADELEILEHSEQRKADVLGVGPDGLRLRVQIRGERIERTDPWSAYLAPESLAAILRVLGPETGSEAELAALYYVIAVDRLATQLVGLAASPDAASAGETRAQIEAWRDAQLFPEQLPAGALFGLQQAVDLCAALEAGDDYLALNRVEDLQSRFGLLSVWTSGGDSTWGLQP